MKLKARFSTTIDMGLFEEVNKDRAYLAIKAYV